MLDPSEINVQIAAAPFLRWSGSKARLVSILARSAPKTFRSYIEPFAGSACLFFRMRPNRATLGDLNPEVIDVYTAVRDSPSEVHRYLASIPVSSDAYYIMRELDRTTLTLEQRAARLIYLMKACFNGVYRTNRQGRFNVPLGSRIYAIPTLQELRAASSLLRGATLVSGDFQAALADVQPGDFVYLDPPYPTTTRYRGEYGYAARFDDEDKRRLVTLAKQLTERNVNVMLSYVHDDEIIEELEGWSRMYESVRRTVASGVKFRIDINEMIMTNYRTTD